MKMRNGDTNNIMHNLSFSEGSILRSIYERCRSTSSKLSKRYTLAILSCLGFAIAFAIRSNECVHASKDEIETNHADEMPLWFFMGYFFIQIPAGILSYKFSATRIFGVCILGCAISALLTPLLVIWYKPVIEIAAFYQGIFEGAAFPAFFSMWRYWAPPLERSTLLTLGYAGTHLGVVIGYQLSVSFCGVFNWDKVLYVYGFLGIGWHLLWSWLVYEHPTQHPTISDKEYVYIQQTVDIKDERAPIVWKQIFTNIPFGALLLAGFCRGWYLVRWQHSQHSQVIHIRKLDMGIFVELHNFTMFLCLPLAGYLADLVLKKTTISTTNLRKYYISGGLFSTFILLVPEMFDEHFETDFYSIPTYVIIAGYCVSIAGLYVNHLDLAPKYAGVTLAVANVVSTIASFLPHVLFNFNSMGFIICAIFVYLIGSIFYYLYGSGEQQSWSKPVQNEEETFTYVNLTSEVG